MCLTTPAEAGRIVPIVFLVIVGTVAVYGLTISPLARWLGALGVLVALQRRPLSALLEVDDD